MSLSHLRPLLNATQLQFSCCTRVQLPLLQWRKFSTEISTGKVRVDCGASLHWERHGSGEHVVLCCPGLAGSVETNYDAMFKKMDLKKFTFVGIDPAGYGKSRPPERSLGGSGEFILKQDARNAVQVMKELGYDRYSTLGWSTGGITATYVGLIEPDMIRKAIACNAPYKLTVKTKKGIENFCNLNTWPGEQKADVLRIYGEEYTKKILNDWRMFLYREIEEPNHYKQLSEDIKKVDFPVLYVAASQDCFMDSVNILGVFDEMVTSTVLPIAQKGHFHFEFLDDFIKSTSKFLVKESNVAKAAKI